MITKAQVQALVNSRANEQTLQALLKQDLSIFAEVYARPHNDFICFSEFPTLGTGNVDFVVFTGRSTLEVYLIEIKGADFRLINQHKDPKRRTFNAKFLEGVDQVIRRMGYQKEHLNAFNQHIQTIRTIVENGTPQYNSFTGPNLPLQATKGVEVTGVVIGGYSVNQTEEDDKRRDYRHFFGRNIKLESWDSWLKWVTRT